MAANHASGYMAGRGATSAEIGRINLAGKCAVLIAMMAAGHDGFAQSVSTGVPSGQAGQTIDEGLRRQAERDRIQQEGTRPQVDSLRADLPSAAVFPALPEESPCFVIEEVLFVGVDVARFRWLGSSTDALLGRCVGSRGVSRIGSYLNAQLIEQGHATSRISLEQQNLGSGRLVIRLHAGRIASVSMVDSETKAPDDAWGTWVNAFPTSAGRLLNVRDLEQGVEQMTRLPSQTVTTTLTPGVDADTTNVVIERRAGGLLQRLRGGVSIDNSGGASLGRTQVAANAAFDNPLGLNDIVGVGFNGNAEKPTAANRSQSANLNYSVPVGYSTLSATVGRSRFAQAVQLTTTSVLSSGDSGTASLRWDHVALRTAASKTGVYAELSTRKSRGYLDDLELIVQRRRSTFIDTGFNFRHVFRNDASADFTVGYRRGMPWLRAEADYLPEEGAPTLRPHIWSVNAGVSVPLVQPVAGSSTVAHGVSAQEGAPVAVERGRAWRYSASFRGQATPSRTTSIDQFAIGNRSTVRGFDGDSVLIAESGWTLRNELSTALTFAGIDSSLYLGLDLGHVWGASDVDLIGRSLAGGAIGVRGRWKAMNFDMAVATPIRKPEGFKTSGLSVYASATFAF
ncbi:ShlB/FhaC/HecB family hemolysin secretion/activation protein [soil metagenome]